MILSFSNLTPQQLWFSKCDPQTSSTSLPWDFARRALDKKPGGAGNLRSHNPSRKLWRTLRFESPALQFCVVHLGFSCLRIFVHVISSSQTLLLGLCHPPSKHSTSKTHLNIVQFLLTCPRVSSLLFTSLPFCMLICCLCNEPRCILQIRILSSTPPSKLFCLSLVFQEEFGERISEPVTF